MSRLEELKEWKSIILRSLPDCYEETPGYMKRLDDEIKELEEENERQINSYC